MSKRRLLNEGILDFLKNLFGDFGKQISSQFKSDINSDSSEIASKVDASIENIAKKNKIEIDSPDKIDTEDAKQAAILFEAIRIQGLLWFPSCLKRLDETLKVKQFIPPEDDASKAKWREEDGDKLGRVWLVFSKLYSMIRFMADREVKEAISAARELNRYEGSFNPGEMLEGINKACDVIIGIFENVKKLNANIKSDEMLGNLKEIKDKAKQIADKLTAAVEESKNKKPESFFRRNFLDIKILGERMQNNRRVNKVINQILQEGLLLEEAGLLSEFELNLSEIQIALNEAEAPDPLIKYAQEYAKTAKEMPPVPGYEEEGAREVAQEAAIEFAETDPLGRPVEEIEDYIYSVLMGESRLYEAEYRGRKVTLGKPMKGDTAKYKVYVRDPKTGNVKKVNFGAKGMEIRRDNPKARKSFRARHGCGKPRSSDRTKAAYWSCRMWSRKPVSKILQGK